MKECVKCHEQVDQLFGLFVPHLCAECYREQREYEIKHGQVCGNCGKPYIDCCC